MKRNLTTIATVVMMVLSLSSFANGKVNPTTHYTSTAILSNYIDSSVLGKQKFVKEMLADNFEFVNASSNSKSTKNQYSQFLKNTDNLTYNCATSYEILDQSGDVAVAKVTMKFENFTRVDIINMSTSTDFSFTTF
ncbi:hypothetical protein [Sphingobacterium composti Ten et al. 2007 non Yoo et al. 2007]|uniref:hypothetical protein n=1 Tax=Sphingobacterium composti TaxID=363260 RepID=UPI001914FF99|nr:hypothetical protein [Sphingobacterium composti Ten et al. 2007 non Yoo et al. 2007]